MVKKYLFLILLISFIACEQAENTFTEKGRTNIALIDSEQSGITFTNRVIESVEFNFLNYPYIYIGGGTAIGDVNNDGLEDVFFVSNQEANKLYLNKGELSFQDISGTAGIEDPTGFSTGVSMIDINCDGWLDIYICKAGSFNDNKARKNKLFINNKDNTFTDKAAQYGLDDEAFSTQAYFLDYDKDGDLDIYLVNHRPDFRNTVKISSEIQRDKSPISSDKIYENLGKTFREVTGGRLNKTWGLSASIADFNEDGWPDIYVANDFLEPDHLWINDQNGFFKDSIRQMMDHISFYSMGSDVADINNDHKPDLVVLDMVPQDHIRSKRNMASMDVENFNLMVNVGYHHQYMTNTLHLNRGNSIFSEIGLFAGIAKTDWSWAPLLADFDNDGFKDLFVTNGVRRDLTDNDFKNDLRSMNARGEEITLDELIGSMPTQSIHNYMYKNQGNTQFKDVSDEWGLSQASYSQGASYGDLDNDGDLDLIVNNADAPAFLYENKASSNSINIELEGPVANTNGIGAEIKIYSSENSQYYQHYVNRGFLSSSSHHIHFGIGDNDEIDSLIIQWPDNKIQTIKKISANETVRLRYDDADLLTVQNENIAVFFKKRDATEIIEYSHKETLYNDFDREILLPHKMSSLGPKASSGDVNQDGLEDIFIGGSKGFTASMFIQEDNGKFRLHDSSLWETDKEYEDMGSIFIDVENDGDLDLYVVSGGNEWEANSRFYQDRLYLNDGKGNFSRSVSSLPIIQESGLSVVSGDYDDDGLQDLFVGGRVVPGNYPLPPSSFILKNIGGKFKNVTNDIAPELIEAGMITDAAFSDYDQDGDLDLVVVGEWMVPTIYEKKDDQFYPRPLSEDASSSWWFSITSADFNNDGFDDYLLGNLGLNNKFNPKPEKPLHVYANDFDENGQLDIVLAKGSEKDLLPVRGRECSSAQMPFIAEKFSSYQSFAEADLSEIYTDQALEEALHLQVTDFASIVLINNQDGTFERKELPALAQYGPTLDAFVEDVDGDGYVDIIGAGNIYEAEPETVRYDASKGFLLLNDGQANFKAVENSGILLSGNVKDLLLLKNKASKNLFALQNNGPIQLFEFVN